MDPVSQQPSPKTCDDFGAITTANDTNQHVSLFGTHFPSDRNSDISVPGQNFGQTKESFLESHVGDVSETQARVSGASLSSVHATGVEENRNRIEISDGIVALSSQSKPHSDLLLASKSPKPTAGRPPKAPVPSTASGVLISNPFPTVSNSSRLRCSSPTPTTDYADIELKQNELRHAVECRIKSLEQTLAIREEELLHLYSQLRKMEEDYQFNYNLIVERDEALEESSQQLQRLYRELKRVTAEADTTERKLHVAENEISEMRQRVRDVEADREVTLRRVQKEYLIKEQHVHEVFKEKEAALEEERQRVHEHFMQQAREIEESRHNMEGYTASVTSEWAQRHKQAMERLQAELEKSQKKLQSVVEENGVLTDRARRAEEEALLLREQLDLQLQRHNASMDEVLQENSRLESQLSQSNLLLNKGLATAENTIREEAQKNSRLELEKTNLQTKLTEAQERIQQLLSQRQEEVSQYLEERHGLQSNYQNAQREMEVAQERWREAERRLQAILASQKDELDRSVREKQEFERLQQSMQQQLREKEREVAEQEQELARLADQVERWKAAESATAAKDRQEVAELQEKLLNLERALQAARGESEVSKRNILNVQERSQEEVARLTRELHASEAARHALEDQFHRTQDQNAQGVLINSLRYEKEMLEKRILDLERTNSEIREQVANFTLELQNDPVMKSAREMHRRVDQLQQDLLESRDSNQRLQDALKEKEEELARYQVDILRAQILLSNGASSPDNPEVLDNGFSGSLMQHQCEWSNPHTRLDSKDRGRRHNRSTRRHKGHLGASSRSKSSVSSASDAIRSNGSLEKQNLRSKGERGSPRRSSRSRGNTQHAVVSSSPAFLPLENAMNPDRLISGEVLLKEAEVWRHKYYQLEQHLRKVLLDRDRLSQELQLAKQDVSALSAEKQSLLDLNSLLKAQLREAYRTAYEVNTVAKGTLPSPIHPQLQLSLPEQQDTMASPPGQIPAAASAPFHKQRDNKKSSDFLDGNRVQTTSSREENSRYVTIESIATEAKGHGNSAGRIPENHFDEAVIVPASSPAVGAPSDHHQRERLKVLEEEIRFVKNQIANTVHQNQQSRQQSATTRNARRGHGSEEGASVVRKGGQAVRHYGHH
ncbi:unnamed protein product [Phytomonas sp. EM1]|nr:unnamed protein product [Phytomonas sp. EM1]|eukprot:CCW64945.1 unnamed protein product [Phytomonas sp. isolate EM1]